MLHIYYGNGKGKTTAAVGLTVRANGAGMKTAFFQFLKNGSSSEIDILKKLENNTVVCCGSCSKFSFQMNSDEKNNVMSEHNNMLDHAKELVENGCINLIVLDELLDAYNKELIDRKLADRFIFCCSKKTEIVVTGRDPSEEWLKAADYVTEMTAVKHPYNNGLSARKGIEY